MEAQPGIIELDRTDEPEFTLASAATGTIVERPGQMSLEDLDVDSNQTALDI